MERERIADGLFAVAARLRWLTTRLVTIDVLHGELEQCAAAVTEAAEEIATAPEPVPAEGGQE